MGSGSSGSACLRFVDIVHVMVLRYVHLPKSWTLWDSARTGAAVSPIWKPTRVSRTSVDGVAGVSL